jgi:hypothetical protein
VTKIQSGLFLLAIFCPLIYICPFEELLSSVRVALKTPILPLNSSEVLHGDLRVMEFYFCC